MSILKKGLASFLAALMLVSALPAAAAETEEGQKPEVPAETVTEVSNETSVADEVTYNLLCSEITVGTDTELQSPSYVLFDENGNYTIPLEDNAFFPYEVQFAYEGDTWTEWFMDPEDTVTVGGHEFSVVSQVTDPTTLQQAGFWIGDDYVPAFPEEKTFTPVSLMSLQPLKEKNLYVDLLNILYPELKNVKASVLLNAINAENTPDIPDNQVFVWAKMETYEQTTNLEYTPIDPSSGTTMDLRPGDRWNNESRLSLIVGTGAADQLNPDNTRYNVTLNVRSASESLFTASVANTETPRQALPVKKVHSYWDEYREGDPITRYDIVVLDPNWTYDSQKIVTLQLDSKLTDAAAGLTFEFFRGLFTSVEAIKAAKAEDITAQIWKTDPTQEGQGLEGRFYYNDPTGQLTVVMKRDNVVIAVEPMEINVDPARVSYHVADIKSGSATVDTGSYRRSWDGDLEIMTVEISRSFSVTDTYQLFMGCYDSASENHDLSSIAWAAAGLYDTPEVLKQQTDIKTELFTRFRQGDTGYTADFSKPVEFTVLDQYGELQQLRIVLEREDFIDPGDSLPAEPRPDSVDTYFHIDGAGVKTVAGEGADPTIQNLDAYVMQPWDDGYYYNGYQTVFLLNSDQTPVASETIIPAFYTGNKVTMYAGMDHTSGEKQINGETELPFKNGETIQYSAAAESVGHLKNYWVTFLTKKTGGPSLFVNAANDPDRVDEETKLPVREVYLTPEFENHHDVFFANIGDAPMTEISVTLENAQNVALDEYWTVREDGARQLPAFDSVSTRDAGGNSTQYGGLKNTAKVRLVPAVDKDGKPVSGDISGTLVIAAKGVKPVRIKLTGTAGIPEITTEKVRDGVKFVPYNSVIQTNSMGASDAIRFSVESGKLPTGVELFPNGKLYGMPTEAGSFTFTVKTVYNNQPDTAATKEFTVVIAENTDANVDAATDPGYTLLDRVPAQIEFGSQDYPEFKNEVFRSEGTYSQFMKFFLDGRELTEGQDFDSEEGSTKITIRAQTFQGLKNGTHTIAAEFRTNKSDTNTVKRAAQNFTISGLPSSGGGHGGNSKPAVRPDVPQEPVVPQPVVGPYQDVRPADWFAADAQWAKDEKLMIGVTPDLFKPANLISPATVVTVLARMDKVDLNQYNGMQNDDIPAGQWYTNAALWAKEAGLLTEGQFSAQPPIARAKFAVMLYKYLKHNGVDCTLPEMLVAFTDADLMTKEENEAFQVLYQFGIFKGVGAYCMDADGPTTRAQLAVLLHRLSVFVENQK